MNLNTMNENEVKKLEWIAPEHPFWQKTGEWYTSVGIISGSLAIAAVIFGNPILAILILMATIALLLISTVPPKDISIAITKKGVEIGHYRYPFINMESFWINELEEPPRLLLKSKKLLSPLIVIEIVEVEEEEVRSFLHRYIEEEEMYESFFHRLLERLGF